MSDETAHLTTATLRPRAHAPRTARRLVRHVCAETGLPPRLVDDATFVAGELVTQSLRQTRSPVQIQVILDAGEVTLRVHGPFTAESTPSPIGVGALRCWEIVKRLSTSYGYRSDSRGRELWAQLRCAA